MKKLILVLISVVLMGLSFSGCERVSKVDGDARQETTENTDQETTDQESADSKESTEESAEDADDSDEDSATLIESEGNVEIIVPEGQESAGE